MCHQAPLQQDSAWWPLNKVSINILGPLDVTKRGNRDHFTKWIEALPTPNMEAQAVARLFMNHNVSIFGILLYPNTNQGRNFENLLGTGNIQTRTTPYHPQSNRFVERFNKILLNIYAEFNLMSHEDENLDLYLPFTMFFFYRTSVWNTTGVTPFNLMFGWKATIPTDLMFPTPVSFTQPLTILKDLYNPNWSNPIS